MDYGGDEVGAIQAPIAAGKYHGVAAAIPEVAKERHISGEQAPLQGGFSLRCGGCARQEELPQILGIGRGQTEEEARQNALYALTLPVGRWERHWGEGPVQVQVESCVFNRVAYEKL